MRWRRCSGGDVLPTRARRPWRGPGDLPGPVWPGTVVASASLATSASWRKVSGFALRFNMSTSSSASNATVAPLPSKRAGRVSQARRRDSASSSEASNRARSRRPPARVATSDGPLRRNSVRYQGACDLLVGQGPELHTHAAARDGDELRRDKLRQRDENRMEGRFFDRLQQRRDGIARQVEVGSTTTWRPPSSELRTAMRLTSRAWSIDKAAPSRSKK